MSQYEVNLDRTANTPIAQGIHPFVVSAIEEGESQNNNPMWTATLTCLTEGEEGKTVNLYLVLTPKARWKFEQFLDAVGAPAAGTATSEKFLGRKMRCQITHEDYEGRPQACIGQMWSMAAKTTTPTKPDVTAVKKAAVESTTPTVTPTKKAAAPAPAKKTKALPADAAGEEDQIPF